MVKDTNRLNNKPQLYSLIDEQIFWITLISRFQWILYWHGKLFTYSKIL